MRAAVDFRTDEKSVKTLEKLGIEVIKTPRLASVYNAICGHADIMLHKLSDDETVCEPTVYDYFAGCGCNVKCGGTKVSGEYPLDIAYNAARVGNSLFCMEKYTDEVILNYCRERGIKIINTKQGYAKCSVCIVSENAIITSDKNIARCADRNGIDVLVTDDRDIILEDFEHGFIGGASGLLPGGVLAFNGNIELHGDCKRIIDFCSRYNVEAISLNDGPVVDIGSIICMP